jgi:hypothetical protein
MNREKQLRHQLHRLHVEYHEKAKPLVAELVEIEQSKPPRPIIIDLLPGSPAMAEMRRMIDETMRRMADLTGVTEAQLAGVKPESVPADKQWER